MSDPDGPTAIPAICVVAFAIVPGTHRAPKPLPAETSDHDTDASDGTPLHSSNIDSLVAQTPAHFLTNLNSPCFFKRNETFLGRTRRNSFATINRFGPTRNAQNLQRQIRHNSLVVNSRFGPTPGLTECIRVHLVYSTTQCSA